MRTRLDGASDAVLVARAADGDVAAFAVIVRRHQTYLRAVAARITGSSADGDDAVQEALVTAWRRIGELRDPSALRGWLARITHREAVSFLRRRRPWSELGDDDVPATGWGQPERRAQVSSALDALQRVLDTLPETQRQAWVMKEVAGMSYEEIAEAVGVPVSTVRGALARARATVLREMEGWR